jgi:exosortase E/protease (VPEID-CTERM system)
VTELSQHRTDASYRSPSLAVRLLIIGAVLFAEKTLLNRFVDFDLAQAATGFGEFIRHSQHWFFRFALALAASVVVFSQMLGDKRLAEASGAIGTTPLKIRWLLGNTLLVAALTPLTYVLYRDEVRPVSIEIVSAAWTLLAAGAVLCLLRAMAPWGQWRSLFGSLGKIWYYAIPAALIGAGSIQASHALWGPTAGFTFAWVTRLLSPLLPDLIADPENRTLSTENFSIYISDECSGLEGVGLVIAFLGAWLVYFRRDYLFPRALLLMPLGIAAILILNALRIAGLMLIGNAGYADIAVYGFHSQAGWLAFNLVACGMAYLSRTSRFFTGVGHSENTRTESTDNPTATYLLPLLTIIGIGMIARAISGKFETFYALRVFAAVAVLWYLKGKLGGLLRNASWRGVLYGLAVFVVWLVAADFLLPHVEMPQALKDMSPLARSAWILARIVGSVITVPIAEELAYRGYLMRRLQRVEFDQLPFSEVHLVPICLASVIFGFMHGLLWLPGIFAGLAYGGLSVRRGGLGEPILAHATTNALIAIAVLAWGQWQLW